MDDILTMEKSKFAKDDERTRMRGMGNGEWENFIDS